jgi:hypothetical protein
MTRGILTGVVRLSVADKVKELAGLYFSIEDIAVIIEVDPMSFAE